MGKRLEARRAAQDQLYRLVGNEVDLTTVTLTIEPPPQRQPLAVPSDVRLGDTPDGEPAILWNIPPARDRLPYAPAWALGGYPEQAFWPFLDLAEEHAPERFVTFVRRFGPLGLWPYKTPDGHKVAGLDYWVPSIPDGIQTPLRHTTVHGDMWALKEEGLLGILYEPVAEWRRWARWFSAVVEIALKLHADECSAREKWDVLGLGLWFESEKWKSPAPAFATDVPLQRRVLADVVQRRFLRWAGLAPVFLWDGKVPHFALARGGEHAVVMRRATGQVDWPENTLFPALVAQLIAVVRAAEPVARCSTCRRLHPRARRPRVDQPVYCEFCRMDARRKTKRDSMARARRRSRTVS